MDIEVNTLAQIKAETGRDLDNQIDENTLVSGEKSNGTFGVFKLFAAIKNCIDNWITTIAGAKNFTGAVTINSKAVATTEAVNNALANLDKTKVIMLQDGNVDFNTVFVNANGEKATYFIYGDSSKPNSNAPMEQNTTNFIVESVFTNGRVTQTAYHNEMQNLMYIRTKGYDSAWTDWKQIATKSDLTNYNRQEKFNAVTVNETNIVIDVHNFGENDQMIQFYWLSMGNGGHAQLGSFLFTRTTGTFNRININALDQDHSYSYDANNDVITINTGDTAYYALASYVIRPW